jgi:hypothetical protein
MVEPVLEPEGETQIDEGEGSELGVVEIENVPLR